MDDGYQFPVFFRHNDPLQEEQVKRIEKYFRVRRRSGGGECGSLRTVADQIYSVAFRNQREQQAVLLRSEHVVDDVAFTVRDSIELCTSSPATPSAARQHVTAPIQQSQQSIPASTPPPSGEEYEKQLDSYLLRYLKESPEAGEALKRDLASVACSAELYPEEGRVLVRSSALNKVGKWREDADKVFDGYLCHYEADPLKVKALLQSCRPGQATDDVKVYTEVGMAVVVVVGERSQVDARLMRVEDLQEARDHLLQGMDMGDGAPSDRRFQMDPASIQDTAGAPEDGVHLEIVHGTIESQQVDAVVSPMVGQDPLSTRIGNTLAQTAGSLLTARYRMEAGEDMFPGEAVLVDGLAGLPFSAVFFLNLIPWNDDEEGGAVEVLKLAINNILTSCEEQGFGSVALPVLGSGMALRFPDDVVARVLLKEVYAFGQNRHSKTPLSVSIVIHPDDDESHQLFKSVQQDIFAKEIHQPDQVPTPTRIVLLGKTGSGKSNLANTIFGETLFETNASANSGTSKCQAETRSVNGRSLTLIDTPGFFDAKKSEEELKPEIVKCITECSPGPHAFLIVLKVEKFTEHEQAVIDKICQYFSEDALKYAVVVFTHGHDLKKGMKIEEFVSQNENLSKVVKRCGGRCHVVDNKHWNNTVQNDYRSNQLQVEELLKTIDKLVMDNDGGYYVNEVMEVVEKEIRIEEMQVRLLMGNLPVDEIRKEAKRRVSERFLIQLAGTGTGVLLGAFFGLATMVEKVITALKNSTMLMNFMKRMPAVGGAGAAALGGAEAVTVIGVVAGVTTAGFAVAGGAIGGSIGYNAVEDAKTPWEAVEMAANAVINKGKDIMKM